MGQRLGRNTGKNTTRSGRKPWPHNTGIHWLEQGFRIFPQISNENWPGFFLQTKVFVDIFQIFICYRTIVTIDIWDIYLNIFQKISTIFRQHQSCKKSRRSEAGSAKKTLSEFEELGQLGDRPPPGVDHIWLVVTATMEFWRTFPWYWEWNNQNNWRTPSFFRGVGWNHQPDIYEGDWLIFLKVVFFCATESGHFIYASMMLAFHNAMFCLVNSYGNPWVSCDRTSMVDFPIIVVFCTSTGGYIHICNIHHLATSTRNSIHVWRGHLISSMMPNGLV